MNKLKRAIKSSILCIRFPFLYPRNRWDGKHHAYILNNILYKLNKESICELGITARLIKNPTELITVEQDHTSVTYFKLDSEKLVTHAEGHGVTIDLDIENRKLIIKNHLETKEYFLKKLLWNSDDKFAILGMSCFWNNSKNITICVKTTDETDKTNYGFAYDRIKLLNNKRKLRQYNILKWLDLNVLDRIFIIPKYTELDDMPTGWRNKFGIQMCKEIKQSLLKAGGRKALRAYRITQIKEKFGGLRWYDNHGTKEILDTIIPKYEQLSYETCISCGKPAKYVSKGWVSPYCEDCAKYKNQYVPITEDNAWDKAYTAYWPKTEE